MVPHKVNNTPPPWIHSAAANHTADERNTPLLGLLYNYMNLNKLSTPSQTYLTDIRLAAVTGWLVAHRFLTITHVHIKDDMCVGLGNRLERHSRHSHWSIDNSIALEHMHYFGLISCHILLVIRITVSQSCGVPEWRQRKFAILLCSYRKEPFLPVFRVAQMHVCQWWNLSMNHDLLCFVGSSVTRMRHCYVVNEDHH